MPWSPNCYYLQEELLKMIGDPTYTEDFSEPLTIEQPFKKPEEKLNPPRRRKQAKPTKVDVTKKPKKKKPKVKQETTLVEDLIEHNKKKAPVKQEIVEVMITDQELADATDALVKSSERFDKLMAYYDTMPEKIDGPITLDFLETHVAPEMNRFDQLMDYYMHHYKWHIDGKVDLAFLERNVAPVMEGITPPPPSLKTLLNRETSPKINVERKEFEQMIPCPFHETTHLKAETFEDGTYYLHCPIPSCPVWCTVENGPVILTKLVQTTHDEVKHRLQSFAPLKCDCILTPKMKLSKTAKNFDRVYLTCGNKFADRRCRFFQWIDAPLWKPKSERILFGEQTVRDQAIPLRGRNFGDPAWNKKRKERDFELEMTRNSKVQQLIPYAGDHPADEFLSRLGEDIRAEQRAQQDKEFQKRCDQENKALIAANMMPRSTEFYKQWGFGCF